MAVDCKAVLYAREPGNLLFSLATPAREPANGIAELATAKGRFISISIRLPESISVIEHR
jgi:hypothetical protein